MYSLQEIESNFKPQFTQMQKQMESSKGFHPSEVTMVPNQLNAEAFGIKPADALKIKETLKAVSLPYLLHEFLVKGLAGASYLIPDKIFDVMFEAGSMLDIVPLCSTITSCPGSSLKIDVEVDDSFKAHYVGGGGDSPSETIKTTQVEITPALFDMKPAITLEMIEDSQFDLMELHLRRAAQAMGEFSTCQFLARLITGTHGDGTQNTVTTATASVHYLGDLAQAWAENYMDKGLSDVVILGPEPLKDILTDATVSIYSDQFHSKAVTQGPLEHGNFMGMNVVVVPMNESYAGDGALYLASKWHGFVLAKATATLTVRKRWLRLDKYADPVRDLVGAKISGRQETKCIYNDHSCEITEA